MLLCSLVKLFIKSDGKSKDLLNHKLLFCWKDYWRTANEVEFCKHSCGHNIISVTVHEKWKKEFINSIKLFRLLFSRWFCTSSIPDSTLFPKIFSDWQWPIQSYLFLFFFSSQKDVRRDNSAGKQSCISRKSGLFKPIISSPHYK